MTMDIKSLSPIAGAEVNGFDCAARHTDEAISEIRQAFLDRCFLVFRNQHLSPEDQVAFSQLFGDLLSHVLKQYLLPEHDKILVLSNKVVDQRPVGLEDAGRYWHSDVSYEEVPPLGSMLYGKEIPTLGGDTLFANQYAAYGLVPESLKREIRYLRAHHEYNYAKIAAKEDSKRTPLSETQISTGSITHPVIRRHPETGRLALYISPGFTTRIEGLPQADSDALLAELFAYATDDSVVVRHRWQQSDLLFWDNRCLMHHATDYDQNQIRHMHRTTIAGSKPV